MSDICCRQFSQSAAALQKADDDGGNDVTGRNSDLSLISLTCTLLFMTLLDHSPSGEGREIPIFNYLSYNFVLNSTIDL